MWGILVVLVYIITPDVGDKIINRFKKLFVNKEKYNPPAHTDT